MAIIKTREDERCAADSSRPRTKFLTSFFYSNLCERSGYTLEVPTTLRYFMKAGPKDSQRDPLEYFSKWLIPINISNVHWALMVVRVCDQKIEYVDSIPNAHDAQIRMQNVLRFVGDLAKATGRTALADVALPGSSWSCSLVESPLQTLDCDDCGLFVILNALFEITGQPISRRLYSHQNIYDLDIRTRVACEILKFSNDL